MNPSLKRKLLRHSLCVYVDNTEKVSTCGKNIKKLIKIVCGEKRAFVLMPPWFTPADDFREICPPTICSCGFAIRAWSFINRNKHSVLCSLYLSLVWMHRLINNEIVKRKKIWLVKKIIRLPLISCKRKLFLFFWMKGVLFIFLLRLHWWRKKSVRKPVLCWHEFHLL